MVCQGCGTKLQISRSRLRRGFWWGFAASVFLAWCLGFKGWALILAILVANVVIGIACARLELRYFPPPLEPFDPNARHVG